MKEEKYLYAINYNNEVIKIRATPGIFYTEEAAKRFIIKEESSDILKGMILQSNNNSWLNSHL